MVRSLVLVVVVAVALAYGGWLQVLPAPGHVGAVSEASCSGGSCKGLYNPVYLGPACINVEVWGIRGGLEWAASGGARMAVESGGVLHTVSRWRLAAVPSHHILAYHEVIYGAKPWGVPVCQDESFLALPAKISSLPRIVVAFNYTVLKARPGITMSVDSWLFKDDNHHRGPQAGDVEVLVEVRADFREDYAKIGTVTAPVLVNGRVRYVTFDVILYELDWTFIKFKTQEELSGVVAVDFTYFVDRAKEILRSRGWSRGGTTAVAIDGLNLMSLELGTEIYTGTTAPVDVDVEWYMYRYHIHTEPRSVSTEQALRNAHNAMMQATAPPTTTKTATSTVTVTRTITTTTTETRTVTATKTVTVTETKTVTTTATQTATATVTKTVPITETVTLTSTVTKTERGTPLVTTVTMTAATPIVQTVYVTSTIYGNQTASPQNAGGDAAWMLAAALVMLLIVAWIMRGSSRALALALTVVTVSAALWLAAEASFLKKPVTYLAGQPLEQTAGLQDDEPRLAGPEQRPQDAKSNVQCREEAFRRCGYSYAKGIKIFFDAAQLKAPEVGDSWMFVTTYSLLRGSSPSLALSLETGDWIYVRTLWSNTGIQIRDGSGRLLVRGVRELNFTAPIADVYVVSADDTADVMVGRTWRYCGDGPPERGASRCMWGEGGRWGREIFRLLAVYNYWHMNRMDLADEVRAVVISRVEDVVYPPSKTLWLGFDDNMYALSLYALLKDAGFNVTFAIVDTRWDEPCTLLEVVPVVRFSKIGFAGEVYQLLRRMVDEVGVKISYKTFCTKTWINCDDLYVLIDTYNVFMEDHGHAAPIEVLYVEGLTQIPQVS
jgi:hypothetical protein